MFLPADLMKSLDQVIQFVRCRRIGGDLGLECPVTWDDGCEGVGQLVSEHRRACLSCLWENEAEVVGPIEAGMRDLIDCSYVGGEVGAEPFHEIGSGSAVQVVGREVDHHRRELALVPIGTRSLMADLFDECNSVVEQRLVVSAIDARQFLDGMSERIDRPSANSAKHQVPGDATDQQSGKRAEPDSLDRWDPNQRISGCGQGSDREAAAKSEEDDRGEDRDEEDGGRYLDGLHAPDPHDPTDDGQNDQAQQQDDRPRRLVVSRSVATCSHLAGSYPGTYGGRTMVADGEAVTTMPVILRNQLALVALLGLFLIPLTQSSLRGLTHVLTCEEAVATPFTVDLDGSVPIVISAVQVTAGEDPRLCGALEVRIAARALEQSQLELTFTTENTSSHRWNGTVTVDLSDAGMEELVSVPISIGGLDAAQTRVESVTLRIPPGRYDLSGTLLVGP